MLASPTSSAKYKPSHEVKVQRMFGDVASVAKEKKSAAVLTKGFESKEYGPVAMLAQFEADGSISNVKIVKIPNFFNRPQGGTWSPRYDRGEVVFSTTSDPIKNPAALEQLEFFLGSNKPSEEVDKLLKALAPRTRSTAARH